MKFHITTFGCQMNVHDSQWLARALESRGWQEAGEDEALVYIFNTCSVRDKPEQKVYSELGRIAAHLGRDDRVFAVVGGCVAQQIGRGFFERFPFVRLVFGSDGIVGAPNALERLVAGDDERVALLDFMPVYEERETPGEQTANRTRQAFVTIMQGCDNFCAYCIVPYTRGRQKSRHPDAVVDECRALVASGVREITLLGQNVNSFGLDKGGAGVSFAQLLRRVAGLDGLDRLRFTTSHPKDIAPEVIAAFGEFDMLCPSLHLPLQSGSDAMLKAMRRRYTLDHYMRTVEALRRARPGIALTTDLIVGFPGETEADFQATLDVMEAVGYDSSFSFKYSDRPGVAAVNMEPKVDPQVAADRLMRLQTLQNSITRKCLKMLEGVETDVFVEGLSRIQDPGATSSTATSWKGRDPAGRIVNVPTDVREGLVGLLMPVRITQAKKHSLMGERIGTPW
ncbi:MAG: tRNA (N6-isopentenyl adenosine(37)-C2)-methylthiotransferase MiaB [Pseudodesulfovibrio sp.]|uniref:tRNA-2-methylthio-N(6)-dimethylallyladenosine synthase n=1 Tax=Pseudodesulfovibrio aespoeensis (strain ATCC 700646 / DSM 10631 / Aspo-2) TaxID=643562 RepID=E6VVY4_PSEA9|nr:MULTISPECIES: tRNA (N6-isopentenyl adenosine(37)-C2)-methylthiotransferase MiaB [Pseudodesulfovibrio]MBU4192800.1 tRNA (N6-isopentenyl adenosine(37)-C2)-methylthiotransferase MiaB [Pseudomonadota bacterium]ADU62429.1 RNA modification enzyme, MiaB family [Pseudodesulfovibrio aespoeensis Aspo-2]MBU4244164.1 tRNA (N6-isopentenyl adenosine(37)-C2)-methylthiotransferase MiaB [Pseudomonadota bacterium]MBU4377863.1 tRNA (N6-isopentenyl adenosine(37)-C2)-methylthiotransferase MiaB [Pseudomonadota ba